MSEPPGSIALRREGGLSSRCKRRKFLLGTEAPRS